MILRLKNPLARAVCLLDSAFFWNIRGISRSPNLRKLKKLILLHKLSVIGICEPKLSTRDMESIRVRLNFDHVISNPSGDLWIFFRFPFTSMVVGESDQHLSISFCHPHRSCPFIVSFVHAKCTAAERMRLWPALLRDKPCHEP